MSHLAGILPVSNVSHGSLVDFPLLSAKVHYDLVDVQSLATLVLTYASNAAVAMEVKYVCPLPSDTSVCSFKAVIDGKRTVKGIVKDKVKAKADYDAALAGGQTAALLEQSNVEIFQVSLGNIHYKQVIDIHISLASLVTGNGELDSLRLVFPSVIAHRYGTPPNELLRWLGRPIKSALDFSVSIQMTSHIKSITSPSHPISLVLGSPEPDSTNDFDPFKAHVSLTSQDHLDKDIVVIVTCQGIDRPRCTVESYSPEEGAQESTDAYSLTLVPRFELPPLPKQEYVFLVDRSGSMQNKMNAVRAALQIMLRSLPSNDTTINIFSFGSRHDSLWPTSVTYGAESLKSATTYVDGMQANYGGTEIRNALHAVLTTHAGTAKAQDVPLTVFILTDGAAYDLSSVQSTIASHVQQYTNKKNFLRIFCMGIGNAVSKAMCDMIARVGQGAVEYVGEDEKPDKKLMTLLRAARGPIITNISVDWGIAGEEADSKDDDDFELVSSEPNANSKPISLFDEKAIPKNDTVALGPLTDVKLPPPPKVQQAPTNSSIPNLYPGFRTSIFAIIKRDNKGNSAPSKVVRVKGFVQDRPVELEVPVTPTMALAEVSSEQRGSEDMIKFLHVLAARALVQGFEDEGTKTGIMSDILKAEVLRVGLRYGITSSETSFVAVDEEGAPVTPTQQNAASTGRSLFGSPLQAAYHTPSFFRHSAARALPSARFMRVAPANQQTVVSAAGATLFERLSTARTSHSAPPPPAFAQATQANQQNVVSSAARLFGFAPKVSDTRYMYSPPSSTSDTQDIRRGLELAGFGDSTPVSFSAHNSRRKSSRISTSQYDAVTPARSTDLSLSISIESVARYQTFDGFFDGSPELHTLLVQQHTLPDLPEALQQLKTKDLSVPVGIWRTIICILFLQTKFPDDENVWELIVEKGESWVKDAIAKALGNEDVLPMVEMLKKEAKKYII